MSGQMMNCDIYENHNTVEQYLKMFNPYETRPSIGIDLVTLTRYAKKNNKTLKELSEEEMALFKR